MPSRDLSHPLDSDTTVYPGDPAVELTPAATHEADGYRVTDLRLGSHSGTHIDAPSHTEPDGRNLDEFEVGEFTFEARLVDCSGVGARESIGPDDLFGSEALLGSDDLPADLDSETDLLVVRTGWDEYWGTDRYYDHPYLSRETATWCAERGLHVGLDTLSPDCSPSKTDAQSPAEPDGVPAHHELLGSERFVLENLTGLVELPERFELRAYPLSLAAADGSPVRAVAVWD